MAYDANVTSSILQLEIKRRIERVDFQRPPVTGAGSLTANCYLRESTLNATAGSPRSGSVLSDSIWMIEINRAQILGVTGAATFLNGLINLVSDLKSEFDASGSLATGSISQIG